QPAGDLWLDLSHPGPVTAYRRALDLATAVATTTIEAGGITFTREVIASVPDNVIAIHLTASRPGNVSLAIRLTSEQAGTLTVAGSRLTFVGRNRDAEGIEGRLRFSLAAQVVTQGGRITASGDTITIERADAVTIYVDAATSFRRFDDVDGDHLSPVAS